MKRVILFLFAGVILAAGCGYSTRATTMKERTIYIAPFENGVGFSTEGSQRLYLPLLEVRVRKAVNDRFLLDGNLRPVKSEKAELMLKGKLVDYQRDALRYTDNNDVQEYRVRVVVDLELIDPKTETAVWAEKGFAGEATYFLTGPQAKSEDAAVEDALTDLARRTVERTIENW
ncbi:MAG: hypothetical protein HQL23_02810 [Candidatus Omnitrophica bacterium]|nr:hypothetical protein [Candidatus Omnitrophota bacterium]